MNWRDVIYALFNKKPPPRKQTRHGPFMPPHSLPDGVEKKWPSKKERGQ